MRSFLDWKLHVAGLVIGSAALLNLLIVIPLGSHIKAVTPNTVTKLSGDSDLVRTDGSGEPSRARLIEAYGKLPLSFEACGYHGRSGTMFMARGLHYTAFLMAHETVIQLSSSSPKLEGENLVDRCGALSVRLVGAKRFPRVEGLDPLPTTSNYLIGKSPLRWRTNISNYSRLKYESVYPGVDQVYYGDRGHLEHDFVIAPYAVASTIRLAFKGTDKPYVNALGDLLLKTPVGEICYHKPQAYQETNGVKKPVNVRYLVGRKDEVSFRVGRYDKSKVLTIDPILDYSTYLGGSGFEQAFSIAVDASGEAYITGTTRSTNFPTENPYQPFYHPGTADAFVVKINSTGTALIYSTYLGGSGDDVATGIAIDDLGNAYVTGSTNSFDFPTTPNGWQPTYKGGSDVFVVKLNPVGSAPLYSTYVGGSGTEEGGAIALDPSGNAYVTGDTASADFPTLSAFQQSIGGGKDCFVTKLGSSGLPFFSTYLGGASDDEGFGIAVDQSGNAYVTGSTSSNDFPTTRRVFQRKFGGGECDALACNDAFVTKLSSSGSTLMYSTYLGGMGEDDGFGITIDSLGNAYVTGSTDALNFPTTVGAYQRNFHGGNGAGGDAFVSKLNADASGLVFSTYLGGTGAEVGSSIAVDSFGNTQVVGTTDSFIGDFPTKRALRASYAGGFFDGFISKINSTGTILVYSSYFGGNDADFASGVALDSSGNAYVTGATRSTDFPLANPIQRTLAGSLSDVFISKIAPGDGVQPPPVLTSLMLNLKGEGVDHLVAGAKAKKYRVIVAGSGFTDNTQLLINGNLVQILSIASNEIVAKLLQGRVGMAGTWPVQAADDAGQLSNVLTIEIRNE